MILTRFHKEEAAVTGAHREAAVAASAAVGSTGRAVLIAGTGLFLSLGARVGHRTEREPVLGRRRAPPPTRCSRRAPRWS